MRTSPRSHKLGMGVVAWAAALLIAACSGTASDSAPHAGSSVGPTAVEARLAAAIGQQLKSGQDYDRLRAIVVLVKGRTVFEQYYRSSPEQYRNSFSVTKSVMSTLIGIAVGEGKLHPNDTLAELLPTYAAGMSRDVARTTLRQVLTMTAGFPGEIDAPDTTFTASRDWVGSILKRQARQPGDTFAYSEGAAHLLSAILVNATGMSVLEYARARLFDPLGIVTRPALEPLYKPETLDAYLAADFAWSIDPQRRHIGFSDIKLRPRDMAKLVVRR
jgi:CubicO group peptidase (beta-lactamase class C family)